MNKIGLIQGRLTQRPFPKLQEFPAIDWRQEFEMAKRIGYDCIEWIFEKDHYSSNPIWSVDGRNEIKALIAGTGVTVESVCADYFLERPFFRNEGYTFDNNLEVLFQLIEAAADIGAGLILLPVLEKAELRTPEEKALLIQALKKCGSALDQWGVRIGLETELPAQEYRLLVKDCGNDRIGVYYDAGNCAAKGYDMRADMEILRDILFGVHVKDRVVGGGSVYLGQGDTNFLEGIPYLLDHGFEGNFVLQTFFEHQPEETAVRNLQYMKRLIGDR